MFISQLAGLILAIVWATAQFFLLDVIASALGLNNLLYSITGQTLDQLVQSVENQLGVGNLFDLNGVNIFSLGLNLLIILVFIIINFIFGALEIIGVDAFITAVASGLNNRIYGGQGLNNQVVSTTVKPINVMTVLDTLGILNIVRLFIALIGGDLSTADCIVQYIVGGTPKLPGSPCPGLVPYAGNLFELLTGLFFSNITVEIADAGGVLAYIRQILGILGLAVLQTV